MAETWILAPPGEWGKMAEKWANYPKNASKKWHFPIFRPFSLVGPKSIVRPFFHFGPEAQMGSARGNQDRKSMYVMFLRDRVSFRTLLRLRGALFWDFGVPWLDFSAFRPPRGPYETSSCLAANIDSPKSRGNFGSQLPSPKLSLRMLPKLPLRRIFDAILTHF